MEALTYCRVSSKEQEEKGYSLDAQETLLGEYAAQKDYTVKKAYKVAESASKWQVRKTLEEMLSYADKHNINIVLCEKIDRLTRSMKDATIVDEWVRAKNGREVHFVKERFTLNAQTKAHDNLVWDMKVAVARFYTNNLSEEVRKGQKEKLNQGWLPTKPPLGYKTVGEKGKKIHVPDEAKASYIQEMYALYATGKYSLQELCRVMKKKGLRTGKGYGLVKSRMASLLSEPFYYGAMRWNDVIHERGAHHPIIEKALFDEVQRVMHRSAAPAYSKHLYTLKGFIKCAECKGTVTWEKKKGIMYGHCNGYRKCTKRPWYKEKDIFSQVSDALGKLVIESKRVATWLQNILQQGNRNEAEQRQTKVADLNAQVERIGIKLDQMYEDRLSGRISADMYDKKARQFEQERKDLQHEVTRQHDGGDKSRELRIKIYELSQRAPAIFLTANIEKQRTLLGLVFEKLEMKDGKLEYTLKEPFAALADAAQGINSSKLEELVKSPIQILELENLGLEKGESGLSRSQRSTLLRG